MEGIVEREGKETIALRIAGGTVVIHKEDTEHIELSSEGRNETVDSLKTE